MTQTLIFVMGWIVGLFTTSLAVCLFVDEPDVDDEDYYDSWK